MLQRDVRLSSGGAKGNLFVERDYRSYAGAQKELTGEFHSSKLQQVTSGEGMNAARAEAELQKSKTKSAARQMVANMVAERLAASGVTAPGSCASPSLLSSAMPASPGALATPRTHGNGNGVASPAAKSVPASASLPSSKRPPTANAASSSSANGAAIAALTPAGTAAAGGSTALARGGASPALSRGGGGGGGGGSVAASCGSSPTPGSTAKSKPGGGLEQPVWRPAGSVTARAAPSSGKEKPRSWLTRDELVALLDEATRRAESAEAATEGAKLAAELLQDGAHAAERREADAKAAEAAARAHALTIGDLEVKLRKSLEEQGEQLKTALAEEASARDECRRLERERATLREEADQRHTERNEATRRAEKAERQAQAAKEALSAARGTQAEVERLERELKEARDAANTFRALAAEEASAKRAVGSVAKEAKSALSRMKEEASAKQAEAEATAARESSMANERLNALRHVNSVLEGKLRSILDARLKDNSKATTLQEAVQMLTDEYVSAVDQTRALQASLAAEQARCAELEASLQAANDSKAVCLAQRDEASACLLSLMCELRAVDDELVPRLSAQAVEATEMRLKNAELARLESKTSHTAQQRLHAAETGLQRAEALKQQHEEEVNLLKRRLSQALKKVRELQSAIDDAGGKHWVPPVAPVGTHGRAQNKTLSAPPSPWVGSTSGPRGGGGGARPAPSPRGALTMGRDGLHDELDPITPVVVHSAGPTPRGGLEREGVGGGGAAGVKPASSNPDEHPAPRAFTPVAFVA